MSTKKKAPAGETPAQRKLRKELENQVKLEIAAEIGVLDKVLAGGWRSLSAKESGRIGGILSSRSRQSTNTSHPNAKE